MTVPFEQARSDEDEFSEADSSADLFGELDKSVSRLRALSYELERDGSAVHLEHTLDAILNMARKSTYDESITSLDSLRVARPVQRISRKEKDSGSRNSNRSCSLRLLWCGASERNQDPALNYAEVPGLQSKLGSRSKESFWKESRPAATPDHRQIRTQTDAARDDCETTSNAFSSTNSKKNLVLNIGRKNTDEVSSLSSDLFATRHSHASDTRKATVSRSQSTCIYEDLINCHRAHRRLPIEGNHNSFLDVMACHRGLVEHRERAEDETQNDHDMKIVGVRKKSGDAPSVRSSSQSTGPSRGSLSKRKSHSKLSRVEAKHSPSLMADQRTRSDRATIYIYNQASSDQSGNKM